MRLENFLIINESGYPRMMQIMAGLVPTVKSFAIVTWENPMGKKADDKFNKEANKRLKDTLKRGNFSYNHIKGRYNDFENPFVVFNVSTEDAKNLGFGYEGFKQYIIIFGKRYKSNDEVGINIQMLFHDNRKPLARKIWQGLDVDTDDFYSEFKGRKFQIPFFDDKAKGMNFKNGKVKVIENHNVYDRKHFTDASIEKIDGMVDVLLEEDRSGMFLYTHRGLLQIELDKLWIQSYSTRKEEEDV